MRNRTFDGAAVAIGVGPTNISVKFIDTSAEMMKRCQTRAAKWQIPAEYINGQIDELDDESVDLVITCSVLHHLPQLFEFCRQLDRVIKPGGFYIHVHDPRRGAHCEPIVVERVKQLAEFRRNRRRRLSMLPIRIAQALYNKTSRLLKSDYLDQVNQRLIQAGLIKLPLAPNEIWSITDLRHGELPYSAVDGIDAEELRKRYRVFDQFRNSPMGFMASCRLIYRRSSSPRKPPFRRAFARWYVCFGRLAANGRLASGGSVSTLLV